MIESAVNAVQVVVTGVCASVAFFRAFKTRKRAWLLLGLFLGACFLGDLYWQLFLIFYRDSPQLDYVSSLDWYAMVLFLLLLFEELQGERSFRPKHRWLWVVPIFTFGMAAYYMRWGSYVSNTILAFIMTVLIWRGSDGLLSIRGKRGEEAKLRAFYAAVLFFCFAEYALWTASCIWDGDTIDNMYFWCDLLLSVSLFLFMPAMRKAVDR
ncbi:MAG: hypothetical protein IKX54_00295 [Lachnospiraceae bacterium]|nr:hypothetical protein [Lachnospiraceae bacterium]